MNVIFLILIESHLPKYHGVHTIEINGEYFFGFKVHLLGADGGEGTNEFGCGIGKME